MAMTEKQKRFCEEYLINLNATQAAIKAGYSKKTARFIGQENLTKPYISEYLQKRMDEKKSALIASQDEVLETLTRILRREEKEQIVVTCKHRESYYDDEGRKCVTENEQAVPFDIPTKVSDVNRAAELIGKRYGLFSDKVTLEGSAKVVIVDDLEE